MPGSEETRQGGNRQQTKREEQALGRGSGTQNMWANFSLSIWNPLVWLAR